jgi:hypothetical protein
MKLLFILLGLAFGVLAAADAALNIITPTDGSGNSILAPVIMPEFHWTAVVLLALLTIGLLMIAMRIWRRN